MVKYRCKICGREFSTSYGLTQHRNAKHRGRTTLQTSEILSNQRTQQPQVMAVLEHDTNLWNAPITMPAALDSMTFQSTGIAASSSQRTQQQAVPEPVSQVSDEMDITVFEEAQFDVTERYNLRSQVHSKESEENDEESSKEDEQEQFSFDLESIEFDLDDLLGATLDDALDTIEGKNKPENIAEWPNDAYRDFMNLVTEGNISNKIGDKIIKFFNKYSALDKSPLPSSTKGGKDYLNQIDSPSLNFKEKVVDTYDKVDFTLYYRPIFRAIQVLLQRPQVADNFVTKGTLKKDVNSETRIFGELYEGDWWLETEKNIPPLNNLLSIILYSDATTFDGLGKISGHPVFLTLGNLPNWVRNLPESKVLLGFLPKVQDSGIKTTEAFRSLQREVYHKCFFIMLRPLLKKPDALYFGIRGKSMNFAARISVFLADMLEADDVTATYKSYNCKMPCHTCMVLRNDLNNMNIISEVHPRTHKNMQEVIRNGQNKDYSVHSVENAFWKFP